MKCIVLASYLILASGGPLLAADSAGDGVSFACGDIRLPTLAQVTEVTGNANAGDSYRTREVLLHQAERLCKAGGVAGVRFVPEPQVTIEPISVAAR